MIQTQEQIDAESTEAELTARKAWTVDLVRLHLPRVYVLVNGRPKLGRVTGRKNDWASVWWGDSMAGNLCNAEYAWRTIADALNNDRPLRV